MMPLALLSRAIPEGGDNQSKNPNERGQKKQEKKDDSHNFFLN
jgi:hypothetical protein